MQNKMYLQQSQLAPDPWVIIRPVAAPELFWWGHRGGKMRFWEGQTPKISRKWLILVIFFLTGGKGGGDRASDAHHGPFIHRPTIFNIYIKLYLWNVLYLTDFHLTGNFRISDITSNEIHTRGLSRSVSLLMMSNASDW